MRLTIAKKLWLGFGTAAIVPILTALTIMANMRTVEKTLDQLTRVEEPAHKSANRMMKSLAEEGLSVLRYLTSSDPKYRDEAQEAESQFLEARAQYNDLARTSEERQLGETANVLFQEHKALGEALMQMTDEEDGVRQGVWDHFRKLHEMVHRRAEGKEATTGQETVLNGMDRWLEKYLKAPLEQFEESGFEKEKSFQQFLANYKTLPLSREEKDWFREVEGLWNRILFLIEKDRSLEKKIQVEMKKFLEIRSKTYSFLEEEILVRTRQNLEGMKAKAREAVADTKKILWLTLLIGFIIAVATATTISNKILNSVRTLIEGTEKIGKGALGHRIDLKTKDEMEELSLAFNRMGKKLEEAALFQDRVQAEKLELTRGMSAGAAHEIRNLLTIFQQGADYFSKKTKRDGLEFSLALQNMQGAVTRGNYIVKGLSEVASLSTRKSDMELVGLVPRIEQALSLVNHEIEQSRIEVIKDFQSDLSLVEMDRDRIEQVFAGLFLNAIQAMPQGGTLAIKAYTKRLTEFGPSVGRREEDKFGLGETAVVVDIDDTGPGIPEEILPRIFDLFFTTRRDSGSTGLGLSVARGILEIHQGTIEITNRPEGGARARVMLKG